MNLFVTGVNPPIFETRPVDGHSSAAWTRPWRHVQGKHVVQSIRKWKKPREQLVFLKVFAEFLLRPT